MNKSLLCVVLLPLLAGCGGAIIEPGHRGVLFDPRAGVKPEVLGPGYHATSSCFMRAACARVDDFDVTFSTKKEVIHSTSSEGLAMDLKLAVIYRPVISELYELDTEIGQNYYDEVIGPEFRSAATGVFARHSYGDLQKRNEKIEDEVESELRRRTHGKHVEIASITIEEISYAPEIARAVQMKLVGEQEALRQKAAMENDALRRKIEIEQESEREKLKATLALEEKKNERALEQEQAAIDKAKTETEAVMRITDAKSRAEEMILMAKAEREKNRAQAVALTPLTVMMHAYDALGQLGGSGTTIMLGDWSRTPQFLFPASGFLPNLVGPNAQPNKHASTTTVPDVYK